jgi:hypothetical protein
MASTLIKSRRRSSVSFSPTSQMYKVDKHENKSDLFYSAQEMHSIKQRKMHDSYNLIESNITHQDLITMLENVDADTSTFLGLESCLSKSTYIQTIKKRRASVEAVLYEQDRQLSLGVYDPNTLAIISVAETTWARERARTIGLLHSE